MPNNENNALVEYAGFAVPTMTEGDFSNDDIAEVRR